MPARVQGTGRAAAQARPAAPAPSLAELLRGRLVTVAALVGVTVASWLWLRAQSLRMDAMGGMGGMGMAGMANMPGMVMSGGARAWTFADAALTLAMWVVMMIGMMLPGAFPMILTFAAVGRRRQARGKPFVAPWVFTAGYVIVWSLFSLAATAAQWGLVRAALLSPTLAATSPIAAGVLFVAAGLYQFTPLKHACLHHCRSPFDFIINRWQDGTLGALRMGTAHGLYCLGCCWVLMMLMFAQGVMNLLWMAALAAFVFAEKLFPGGRWVAQVGGALMLGFGTYLVMRG